MTSHQPLADTYRDYLGGRITFEDLKRATDRATEARLSRKTATETTSSVLTKE